ncbi:hypothetical protein [Rubinisphaera italica]|uniref:Uncharacterized protein n=1 Tax=Rubinisphaera italica TaxID=2527969 RepID=A0A5C5XH39_9PLAN|nr:hypothetical protein [Rubinisphaera italica]TWT62144.1 hypothetical protein Pan54_28840 [Rubinisphaera italica]
MWVDILLAVVALAGVTYGIAGDPRKDGKLTMAGKGIVVVAAVALVLSIIKSVGDENDRVEQKTTLTSVREELVGSKSNTDRIPSLIEEIARLQKNTEDIRLSTATAASETAKLRGAISQSLKVYA